MKWERWNKVERANGPHCDTLHVVGKFDGGVRPVLDLRQLNKYVIVPRNQVETVNSLLSGYTGKTYFSKFDLSLVYLQVLLSPLLLLQPSGMQVINFSLLDCRMV